MTPEGAEPLEYRVAYYQFILPNYLQQRAIWDDRYATAKANHDAIAVIQTFLIDPAVGALGGMVVGKAIGLGVGAYRAANAAKETTTVIGRVKDLENLAAGERSLLDRLPNLGNPKSNWGQNSGVLRTEMERGLPIRDASPGDIRGAFLNAERNLLESRG